MRFLLGALIGQVLEMSSTLQLLEVVFSRKMSHKPARGLTAVMSSPLCQTPSPHPGPAPSSLSTGTTFPIRDHFLALLSGSCESHDLLEWLLQPTAWRGKGQDVFLTDLTPLGCLGGNPRNGFDGVRPELQGWFEREMSLRAHARTSAGLQALRFDS